MLYTKKALQMGAIAVGFAAFAGQSSLAESAKKEDSKPSARTETMQVMPELTMASHFVGVPYNRSGVSVSVINPEEFQKAGIETLTGALSQTPGVFTLDGGGTWQRGSVSNTVIRGMNKETYTLTMVDGMRISDVNMSGNKLLGITNLFTVGNVEVVKGAQGAVFGSGAIGGVVAMDTPEGEGDPVTRIFAEAGSFHSFNSHVTSSGKVRKLSYFVGVGFESTENDPTIYPAIYDNRKGMNDFRQWQEAVRLGYDVNDKVKVGFTYRRLDSYFEYPTPYVDYDQWPAVTDPHLYNTEDKNRSNLVTGRVDAEITKLWSTSFMIGHYNMDYSTHTPGFDFQPNVMRNRRFQTEWRNALTWNKKWQTVAGMAWDRSDYMSENNYVAKDEWQSTLAFFAEQMWAPTDNFDASVALRLEHDSVWNNHFTWRYSNSWKVTGKDSPTRIFGSVGSGFRAPTYFEQYAANYGYVGNPDLDVSKSLGGDLGVEQRLADNHYASVTGFWTRINDEIGTKSVGTWPNSYTTYDNFSHATSYGVEVAFKGQFKDAWNSGYYANYTFTMPKRDSIGKYETVQMANTARHTINAEVYTSPVEKLTVGFGVTSAMGRTDYNYARLDNFFTARLFARYQVTDNVALHVRVENLFDQNFIITNDYNFGPRQARGLGVFGGVTVEF
ncbi:TonB-dependent receptor [Akkermansia sp.]|uniref:TonB-dependent receptor plug domain-containing protein n=1 Tax=Akkermansia sp. TaxID=1872421 RepID=UPI0025BCBCF8|nr:TonB-dependent receptor [Akkermansia sp.]MCD8063572.1 TonB-dependent receptor [Akkermansia sp.]